MVNYLVIFFLLLFDVVKNREHLMNNRSYYHEAAYFMTGFLIGYCTLYTGQELTPGREGN